MPFAEPCTDTGKIRPDRFFRTTVSDSTIHSFVIGLPACGPNTVQLTICIIPPCFFICQGLNRFLNQISYTESLPPPHSHFKIELSSPDISFGLLTSTRNVCVPVSPLVIESVNVCMPASENVYDSSDPADSPLGFRRNFTVVGPVTEIENFTSNVYEPQDNDRESGDISTETYATNGAGAGTFGAMSRSPSRKTFSRGSQQNTRSRVGCAICTHSESWSRPSTGTNSSPVIAPSIEYSVPGPK